MMENVEKEANKLWWRSRFLQLVMTSLRMYKQTGDKTFLDYSKYFGNLSKKFNE
jgi:hypothetical protein